MTNGFWAKTPENAKKIVDSLVKAGLTEVNISTGLDHQEWVHEDTVINAAQALVFRRYTKAGTRSSQAKGFQYVESIHG